MLIEYIKQMSTNGRIIVVFSLGVLISNLFLDLPSEQFGPLRVICLIALLWHLAMFWEYYSSKHK